MDCGRGHDWHAVMRLASGSCIDRFGSRIVWLLGTGMFAAACFAHLAITSYTGVAVYVVRGCLCSSLAIAYGASFTLVTSRAPTKRMAEIMGTWEAGFIGLTGPRDWRRVVRFGSRGSQSDCADVRGRWVVCRPLVAVCLGCHMG